MVSSKQENVEKVDCLIIGGGMIGGATAVALADLGLKVAVAERSEPQAFAKEQAFDLRVSAISLASQNLLSELKAWPFIEQSRTCVYKRLGVWEQELSYAEFNCDEINQSHLGHIIENRIIQLALWQQMQQHQNIELLCPTSLQGIEQLDGKVRAVFEQQVIESKILVAADGANSFVRKLAGIGITGWDYGQHAMLINVETEMPQQDITWQQFFETGPIAFLPMPGNNGSLVWYHHQDEIKRLTSLSNQELEHEVHKYFPKRLGRVKVKNKASFKLTRRHANQYVKGNVVLLGDAAHTINPLAGQGVNLGFKDVKALQMVIAKAIGSGESYHSEDVLKRYEQIRRNDNLMMMSGMDAIYATFSNPALPVKLLRNIGLFVANKAGLIKSQALKYACGIS